MKKYVRGTAYAIGSETGNLERSISVIAVYDEPDEDVAYWDDSFDGEDDLDCCDSVRRDYLLDNV